MSGDERGDFGYGVTPQWSWNGPLDTERIERGVKWIDEIGAEGFFPHYRNGVRDRFMGHAWLEHHADAINAATEHDLDVWLYDATPASGGDADDQVQEQHPEYRARGLRFERATVWADLPHDAMANADFARAFVLSDDGYEQLSLDTDTPDDTGTYLGFWLEYSDSYVDTRNPDTVAAFLELAYEPHADYYGEEFGNTILGVFTDEPHDSPALDEPAIPWSAVLAEEFGERMGYDVRDHLPALVTDVDGAESVRYDFYRVSGDLFVESFTEQIESWCADHDLWFTGHFMEHSWPDLTLGEAYMPHFAVMSIPGIDCLFRSGSPRGQDDNERMLAELDSVAHQLDKPRTLVENWGAAGWDVSLDELRRMADWLLVGGLDFYDPHLIHEHLAGPGKQDFPQSFGPHMAGADELHPLFDHIERVAEWLNAGEKRTNVGVLHPASTVWTRWVPGEGPVPAGEEFESFVSWLYEHDIAFDLVDETILADEGSVDGDSLHVGRATYETLVVPAATDTVSEHTRDTLTAFADTGGDLVFVDGACLERVAGEPADLAALNEHESAHRFESRDDLREHLDVPVAVATVDGDPTPDVLSRVTDTEDGTRCFVVNRADESKTLSLSFFDDLESIVVADTFTETTTQRSVDGTVELALEPHQSLCLAWGDDPDSPVDSSPRVGSVSESERLEPDAVSVEPVESNVAVLDFCELCLDGDTYEEEYVLEGRDRVFEHRGVDCRGFTMGDGHWWRNVKQGDKRRRIPGFEATYRFEVAPVLAEDADLALIVERPDPFEVAVNGEPVAFDGWWLDPGFRRVKIGGLVTEGENRITLATDSVSIEHALAPAYLVGDHLVDISDPIRPRLTSALSPDIGDLTIQGYPFYTGTVTYRGAVDVPDWEAIDISVEADGLLTTATIDGTDVGIVGERSAPRDLSTYLDGTAEIAITVHIAPGNTVGPLHSRERPSECGIQHPGMLDPHPTDEDYFRYEHQVNSTGLREPFALVPREIR